MNETVVKNYDNKKSLKESQEILLRTAGFEDVRGIKKTGNENNSVTLKFRKALNKSIFNPLVLNEHRDLKITEYEKNAVKIEFESEYDKDDYILRLFTKWSINDLLHDKKRLSHTFEHIARFRNNEFIQEDEDFKDIKANLIYDTMMKYRNEEFKIPEAEKLDIPEQKEFKKLYKLKDEVWSLRKNYYDYTESIITDISDTKENDTHFISIGVVIIKTVYSAKNVLPYGKFMVKKHLENIFEVHEKDSTYFCTDILQNNILSKKIPYFFTENDIVEKYEKVQNDYTKKLKNFIENEGLIIYGNDVTEYNHIYNIMLSEYKKMKQPDEKVFNLRLLTIFPLDMSKEKNTNLMGKLYRDITSNSN